MSRTVSGRPVRFFVVLMGGWTVMRLGSAASSMFWPNSTPEPSPDTHQGVAPMPGQEAAIAFVPRVPGRAQQLRAPKPTNTFVAPVSKFAAVPMMLTPRIRAGMLVLKAQDHLVASAPVQSEATPTFSPTPVVPLALPHQAQRDRWRGSGWLFWRDGSVSRANIVTAGRLGGSQAGLRLDYDLTPASSGRAAAYGRVTAALNHPASPEGALGLAWQPSRAFPVSIAAERRIALGKGARDANALLAVGGFGPTPVVPGLDAEAYAQAGVVGFHRRDLFADGKFSLLSPIARSPLRLGASLSGGAQPGVERLDIGPEVQLRLPLPQVAARLSIEWRERIAGQASPPSGLAVTLGTDF